MSGTALEESTEWCESHKSWHKSWRTVRLFTILWNSNRVQSPSEFVSQPNGLNSTSMQWQSRLVLKIIIRKIAKSLRIELRKSLFFIPQYSLTEQLSANSQCYWIQVLREWKTCRLTSYLLFVINISHSLWSPISQRVTECLSETVVWPACTGSSAHALLITCSWSGTPIFYQWELWKIIN